MAARSDDGTNSGDAAGEGTLDAQRGRSGASALSRITHGGDDQETQPVEASQTATTAGETAAPAPRREDSADGERTQLMDSQAPEPRRPLFRDEVDNYPDAGTIRDDAGTIRDDAGTIRDDAGTIRDDAGTIRDDADAERTALMAAQTDNVERTQMMAAQTDNAERTQLMAPDAPEPTQVLADSDTDWEERRRARDEALGKRERPPAYADADADAVAYPQAKAPGKPTRSTDKFVASLSLFLLRVVVAVIMGIHGIAKLMAIESIQGVLAQTVIPYPEIMGVVLAICEVLIALSLLFGLLVRLSGLGVALIGIGALVFVHWASFPFRNGYELAGELELLLAAVGILLLCVGGGRWGIDGGIRAARRKAKQEAAAPA